MSDDKSSNEESELGEEEESDGINVPCQGIREQFGMVMDTFMSNIRVGLWEQKKDDDPLDEDDKKERSTCKAILGIANSCSIAKAIIAWKLDEENLLRMKSRSDEVERTGKKLGIKSSTVYWYRQAGMVAHSLSQEIRFDDLPKSVNALASFAKLESEDIWECYSQCKEQHGKVTNKIAEAAVRAMMKKYPQKYPKPEKPEPQAKPGPTAKIVVNRLKTFKATVEKYLKKKGERTALQSQLKLLKEIVGMYEAALKRKT